MAARPDYLNPGSREYGFPSLPAGIPLPQPLRLAGLPGSPRKSGGPSAFPRPRAERQRWNLTRVGWEPPWFGGPLAPAAGSPRLPDLAERGQLAWLN